MMSRLFYLLTICSVLTLSKANACEDPERCIEANSWQLGVAFGAGVRTNPLVDGDNMPLVILPDIAWYGEAAYFDNGELGYQWQWNDNISVDTFARLDRERVFFSFWHTENLLFPLEGFTADSTFLPDNAFVESERRVSINDIARRKWAVNGGLRVSYQTQRQNFSAAVQQDISGAHQGQRLDLTFEHLVSGEQWKLLFNTGLTWKSSRLIDYYYGLGQRDKVDSYQFFDGSAGWQPWLGLNYSYQFNAKWSGLVFAKYQWLHDGMTESPIVEHSQITSVFVGVGYRFR